MSGRQAPEPTLSSVTLSEEFLDGRVADVEPDFVVSFNDTGVIAWSDTSTARSGGVPRSARCPVPRRETSGAMPPAWTMIERDEGTFSRSSANASAALS